MTASLPSDLQFRPLSDDELAAYHSYLNLFTIDATLPHRVANEHLFASDAALKQGVHVVGGPGCGKTRLLAFFTWQAWVRRQPCLILDPTGGITDMLLTKMRGLAPAYRTPLWSRLTYIGEGASDYVLPRQLYHRVSEHDTFFTIANRLPAVFKRQDPALMDAPILGWNSLYECLIYAGQIAAACDRQIDFVADLVQNPQDYKELLTQTLAAHPELQSAVTYFRALMDPSSGAQRERRTGSLKTKLLPFLADPTFQATFSASHPGIDWQQVEREGRTVLVDLRDELDEERRQFKLIWWLRSFIDYIKYRGTAGRGHEMMLCIDELTQLLGYRTVGGQSVLAEDLEELVAMLGRGYGVNTIISHQNLSQLDTRVQNVLLQMGTQCVGTLTNDEDALKVARVFHRYDPSWVRKKEPVWMKLAHPTEMETSSSHTHSAGWSSSWHAYTRSETTGETQHVKPKETPTIIDHRTVEYTPEEQFLLAADQLRNLPKFTFLTKPASGEGDFTGQVRRISIANFDRGRYPDAVALASLRLLLRQAYGVPVPELVAEMNKGRQGTMAKRPGAKKQQHTRAILSTAKGAAHDHNDGDLPQPTQSQEKPEDFWYTDEAVASHSRNPA